MRNSQIGYYLKQIPKTTFNLVKGEYHFDYDMMPLRSMNMSLRKRANLIKAGMNMFLRNPEVVNMPIYSFIELTSYCNLKCPLCPTGSKLLERKSMSMDTSLFAKIMDEMSSYLLVACLWGWGEPLIHPEIEEILKLSHNRGVQIIVSTNGQNLNDDKVIKALIKYPPTYLIVALDGITDETLSVYRVGAKLSPALEGVKEIYEHRKEKLPILNMRYIVMKHNEHELPELPEFAKRNHFDLLTLRTLVDISGKENEMSNLIPNTEKYVAYSKERVNNNYICDMCLNTPMVCSDGSIDVCCQDFKTPLMQYGNMRYYPFETLWFSEKATRIRRAILNNPDKLINCRDCSKRSKIQEADTVERYDLGVV